MRPRSFWAASQTNFLRREKQKPPRSSSSRPLQKVWEESAARRHCLPHKVDRVAALTIVLRTSFLDSEGSDVRLLLYVSQLLNPCGSAYYCLLYFSNFSQLKGLTPSTVTSQSITTEIVIRASSGRIKHTYLLHLFCLGRGSVFLRRSLNTH